MDLPVALALLVAFAASAGNTVRGSGPIYFDSLAMLVAALLGARQVQRSAQRAALERADSLRGVAFVEFARRLTGDAVDAPAVEGDVHRLSPGDRVEVRSGELVPVDGVVLAGRSAVDMSVETMARLAKLPRIIGVKDATGDLARVPKQRLACGPDFLQLSGEDATALAFNAHGGRGCISVTANVDVATGRYGDCDEYGEGLLKFADGTVGVLAGLGLLATRMAGW